MWQRSPFLPVLLGTFLLGASIDTQARDLTFEDRVEAQEAIARVYHAHQIDATATFEEAVPRAILEEQVREYLRQTVALEVYWKNSATFCITTRKSRGARCF